uniref:Uncharacterized protein n=1 Tax=Lactuca sativa TaxID=4236 RepID=A0A9R1WXQ3_LACSA|nr:hypothetical protein LSAT_V11C800446210 [Lactuca sativa]
MPMKNILKETHEFSFLCLLCPNTIRHPHITHALWFKPPATSACSSTTLWNSFVRATNSSPSSTNNAAEACPNLIFELKSLVSLIFWFILWFFLIWSHSKLES